MTELGQKVSPNNEKTQQSSVILQQSVIRFAKGASSGVLSGVLLQPLQVIKTSMQIAPQKGIESKKTNLSFIEASRVIFTSEGPIGFMRGFTPTVIKNFLAAGTYFSTLYYFEENLRATGLIRDASIQFWASCMARTLQTVIVNPIFVIKTRFEVVGFNDYSNTYDAIRKIYASEGINGFSTGLKVSLIRDVPFSGIFYPIYNFTKLNLFKLYEIQNKERAQNMSGTERIKVLATIASASGFIANIFSCTLTHPIDLIRTRIFFQKVNNDQSQHYEGIYEAIQKIYNTNGVRGFFDGLTARILRKGLGTIVAWSFYEFLIDKKDAMIFK